MAKKNPLTKRLQISKTNQTVFVVLAVASFITVFSIVSTKTLLHQSSYQNRVIAAKKASQTDLNNDLTAVQKLNSSYQAFASLSPNIIGGNPTGNGKSDGDNAKIILDALPASYDFPAFITSLNNLLNSEGGVQVTGIAGQDQQLTEGKTSSAASPQPVPMPFTFGAQGNYQDVESLVNVIQESVRPIQIQSLSLSGTDGTMNFSVTAQSYFQPGKSFNITSEAVQ